MPSGLYPGVAEEAFETVRNGRPLYILGGFGGAASAIYDAIAVPHSPGLERLLDASRTAGAAAAEEVRRSHASIVASAARAELSFAPEAMAKVLSELGVAGLSKSNGLSIKENECLSRSQDVHEILELVVKAMVAVKNFECPREVWGEGSPAPLPIMCPCEDEHRLPLDDVRSPKGRFVCRTL